MLPNGGGVYEEINWEISPCMALLDHTEVCEKTICPSTPKAGLRYMSLSLQMKYYLLVKATFQIKMRVIAR